MSSIHYALSAVGDGAYSPALDSEKPVQFDEQDASCNADASKKPRRRRQSRMGPKETDSSGTQLTCASHRHSLI